MARITTIALLSMLVGLSSAACTPEGRGQRRAWHTLNNTEKLDYLDAELCLMNKPPILGLEGATSRFEELQVTHQKQAFAVHFVGAFLPWHRAFVHAHETALRDECGYKGWQPYWQQQVDAGNFSSSIILDPVYGFGGDGSPARNNCVTTGPFANHTINIGPGYTNKPHCLVRTINDTLTNVASYDSVNKCLDAGDWDTFSICIEDGPHGGAHLAFGGELLDAVSSPGDPVFYLHHAWLDKIWWDWQAKNKTIRLNHIGGTNNVPEKFKAFFEPRPESMPKWGAPSAGDPGNVTTLGHVIDMYGNQPNRTIAEVMDIQGESFCYEYLEPKQSHNTTGHCPQSR